VTANLEDLARPPEGQPESDSSRRALVIAAQPEGRNIESFWRVLLAV
jgi:hypothetical protein